MNFAALFEKIPPGVKLFVKGAVAAFIGGIFTVVFAYFADPGHYSLEHLRDVWPLALAGGTTALAMYLRKSPLPQWRWERATGLEDRRGKSGNTLPPAIRKP